MFKRAIALCAWMAAACLSMPVSADMPPAPAAGGTQSTPAPTGPASPAISAADNTLVSLDFQDADIRNVLKVLAFKSGMNIVAAPDVTGVVNIQLKDVPWQKALGVILSTYGYGFDRKDNIITVMTIENLKKYREDALSLEAQEPLVSRTFTLSFAKAEDAVKIIDKLVSKRGYINYDVRTNSIVIRDVQANLDLIAGVIKSIDSVTPQVSIETKIVETDLSNAENLGVDWVNGLTGSITGAEQPTIFPFNQKSGPSTFLPRQTNFVNAGVPGLATSTTAGFAYGTINANQLQATLQFLSTRSSTRILSNPRIVTLDNQKATINVGEQYPEAIYSFNSSTGQLQVTGFNQLPIGVNFIVTPHVNNAGLITLDVHPQISGILTGSSGALQFVTVNGNQLPITTNQEAETNVMVEDGKTLVIGGLITDKNVTTVRKLPFLGDIPWIGRLLFTDINTTKTKQEVLIFLTPHIITVSKPSAPAASPSKAP